MPFFIQAMAVRSIVRGPQQDRAPEATPASAATTGRTGAAAISAGACMVGSPGTSGPKQVSAPPGRDARPR